MLPRQMITVCLVTRHTRTTINKCSCCTNECDWLKSGMFSFVNYNRESFSMKTLNLNTILSLKEHVQAVFVISWND